MTTTTVLRDHVLRPHRARRAGVLAAVALTLGTFGSACSSSGPEKIAAPTTKAPVTTLAAPTTDAPSSSTTAPATPAGAVVVRSDAAIALHDQPIDGPAARTLPATTEFGSPVSLLVTDATSRPGWVQVLVPGRPTGATAWVKAEGVELRPVTTEIRIDLASRTLTFLDAGKVILTTPVAIGSPDSPTPTGRFSVTDKLQTPDPDGAYGPFAFGLSGRSEVLTEFAGGDGQIGIHGTNDPSSIGKDVSHGCVRVPNDVTEQLNELLPLGTPVVVS